MHTSTTLWLTLHIRGLSQSIPYSTVLTTQSSGGAKHLSPRGSEMSFPPFFGRFQISISTIETDPDQCDHRRQLLPAMTAVTNQLVCIYIDCLGLF